MHSHLLIYNNQKRLSSMHTQSSQEPNEPSRRNESSSGFPAAMKLAGIFLGAAAAATTIQYVSQSEQTDLIDPSDDGTLTFTVTENSKETSMYTRIKATISYEKEDSRTLQNLRELFTIGSVDITNAKTLGKSTGVIAKWEAEGTKVTCTLIYAHDTALHLKKDIQIDVRPRKTRRVIGFLERSDSSILGSAKQFYETMGRLHELSFLGLPRRTDRIVMISEANEIPKLYPMFARCTGYASSGITDFTTRDGKDKNLHRVPLLWVIESDSPHEIPLIEELQHVAKGGHFFDFYVTTKQPVWQWPSGIGAIQSDLLRKILPRELSSGKGNARGLPLMGERFSTGLVLSGSDSFLEHLMDEKDGQLAPLLPTHFDKQNSIRVVE